MPLPSQKYGALQCSAKSKRSGKRCLNNAVSTSNVCRMHGFVPKDKIKLGKAHPNYVTGRRSLETQKETSSRLCELRYLESLGHAIGMMNGKRTPGRKPSGYCTYKLRKSRK